MEKTQADQVFEKFCRESERLKTRSLEELLELKKLYIDKVLEAQTWKDQLAEANSSTEESCTEKQNAPENSLDEQPILVPEQSTSATYGITVVLAMIILIIIALFALNDNSLRENHAGSTRGNHGEEYVALDKAPWGKPLETVACRSLLLARKPELYAEVNNASLVSSTGIVSLNFSDTKYAATCSLKENLVLLKASVSDETLDMKGQYKLDNLDIEIVSEQIIYTFGYQDIY